MKYTDEQIKKAVECCAKHPPKCKKCPYIGKSSCTNAHRIDALDLIKRQEAEIEELKETLNATIAGQETLQKYIPIAKSEAIKEYIELLKAEFLKDYKGNDDFAYFVFGYIDKVAEMVGESK